MDKIILLREPMNMMNICDVMRYIETVNGVHYYSAILREGDVYDDYTHKKRRVKEEDIFGIFDEKEMLRKARSYNQRMKFLIEDFEKAKKALIEEFENDLHPNY